MAPDMMHKAYAQFLRPQSQGHALYFPVQAENISPGCLGYFDDNGDWHLLEQCVDSTTLPVEPFRGDLRTVSSSPYDAPLICSQNLQSRTSQLKLSLE
jgi:hypothetical protein